MTETLHTVTWDDENHLRVRVSLMSAKLPITISVPIPQGDRHSLVRRNYTSYMPLADIKHKQLSIEVVEPESSVLRTDLECDGEHDIFQVPSDAYDHIDNNLSSPFAYGPCNGSDSIDDNYNIPSPIPSIGERHETDIPFDTSNTCERHVYESPTPAGPDMLESWDRRKSTNTAENRLDSPMTRDYGGEWSTTRFLKFRYFPHSKRPSTPKKPKSRIRHAEQDLFDRWINGDYRSSPIPPSPIPTSVWRHNKDP
jgi:hypothetical protein